MELFTLLGYIGTGIGMFIAVAVAVRYKEMQALRNTISNLKQENETLTNLLTAKEKTIEQFSKELETVKTQMKIANKVMESKIEDIKKELSGIKQKSQLQETELLAKDGIIREYKETLIHVMDKCPDANCEQCKMISKTINRW